MICSGLAGTMLWWVGGQESYACCVQLRRLHCDCFVVLYYVFFISKSRMAHLKGPSMSTFVHSSLECVLRGRVAHHPTQWTVCARAVSQ